MRFCFEIYSYRGEEWGGLEGCSPSSASSTQVQTHYLPGRKAEPGVRIEFSPVQGRELVALFVVSSPRDATSRLL